MGTDATADAAIARVARRQHGAFTVDQARAAGLSASAVRRRVESGRWERRLRGVYVLAGVAAGPEQRAMVAQLSRPGAVLSHLTAAALHGLDVAPPPQPSLTVAPSGSGRSPVASVHRLRLDERWVHRRGALVTTVPARTVVDCATLLGARRLGRLVDEAMHLRATRPLEVLAAADDAPHLTAAQRATLEAALEVWAPAIRPGSPAEARLLRLVASWGLPAPQRQVVVRDESGAPIARLDAGWPERLLGLEYDSDRWHGPERWAHDEARHARLTTLGWRIEHVSAADLGRGEPELRRRVVAAHAMGGVERHRRQTPRVG
jgi:hypothetical protein